MVSELKQPNATAAGPFHQFTSAQERLIMGQLVQYHVTHDLDFMTLHHKTLCKKSQAVCSI